jgi:hypothetical protein
MAKEKALHDLMAEIKVLPLLLVWCSHAHSRLVRVHHLHTFALAAFICLT